jgi:hypothetical protein
MLKRSIRAAIRLARNWIAEREPAPQFNCGSPPFAYENANSFFRKMVSERGLRRPHYVWGAVQALNLAKVLGIGRVSFIEFGVAGGNGLTALESIAAHLGPAFGIEIDIHGFDAVGGMPKPLDHRDLPHLWSEGFYPMDPEKLQRKLKSARLHLGLVEQTVPAFLEQRPAPVAFVAFDLCLYSSTTRAFQLFEVHDPTLLLPRVHCFFRNTLGPTLGDFNGERLAIAEFNERNDTRKISKIYALDHFLRPPVGRWVDQYYMAHLFDHPLYGRYDGLIQEATLSLPD